MSVQDLRKLIRDVENSDPRNGGQQEELCGRLRSYQKMMERAQARELAGYLDTAALLTDYLRAMGGIGPEEVQSIVVRLVRQVEEAFAPQASSLASAEVHHDDDEEELAGPLGSGLSLGGEGLGLGAGLSLGQPGPGGEGGPGLLSDRGSVGAKFLGEILLELGYVRAEDIERALHVQRATGIRMGEALVEVGATTFDRIKTALSVQERLTSGPTGRPTRGGSSSPGKSGGGGPPRPLSL